MTTRHATSNCPNCGAGFDSASPIGDDTTLEPSPGDISICLYCGEWLMFDDSTLPTLKPSEDDMKQASAAMLREALALRVKWEARVKH